MTAEVSRVLVIGDVMLDRYVHGRVDRISPEAPVPVLRFEREEIVLGGAGNVHRNVESLGARSTLLTAVGDDDAGRRVEELLRSGSAIVTVRTNRSTTVKTRYVAAGQQLLRQDVEDVRPIDPVTLRELCDHARRLVTDGCRVVVLSDYNKGVLSLDRAAEFIVAIRSTEPGAFIIVDPSGDDVMRYIGASLLKPNRRELELLSGMTVTGADGAAAAARELISRVGCDHVLATLGADGMVLVSAGSDEVFVTKPHQIRLVDVTGAGDTVAAALAVSLAEGRSIREAIERAAMASILAVEERGTVAVTRVDLDIALIKQRRVAVDASARTVVKDAGVRIDPRIAAAKALRASAADVQVDVVDQVRAWRSEGKRVGFVNGCFDVIHQGHLHLLREARRRCDRLMVAVNSDASVGRLKGDRRPFQTAATRREVLLAIRWVDLVTVFDEDTPLELIEATRPDAIFKGSDYTVVSTVGASLVNEVVFIPLLPGHSTTATVESADETLIAKTNDFRSEAVSHASNRVWKEQSDMRSALLRTHPAHRPESSQSKRDAGRSAPRGPKT